MRRLIALALLAACAQPGNPPGGPPDKAPPKIVRVRPDDDARNVRGNSISFEFDEVVSERPQGVPSLADLFLVSPSDGPLGISWRRTRVDVIPRGGLRPNTTYTVQLRPGLLDLENNADSTGRTIIFSTGPDIATGVIAGRVFDWLAARPVPNAWVEALVLPDSARYAASTDSTGAFALRHLPAGRFLLRAIVDQNQNRQLDGRELFDSVTISLADSARRELLATIRDTLGPGMSVVEAKDSLHLRITFDRPLDTLLALAPALFVLKGGDSAVVAIRSVTSQADADRAQADSLRRMALQDSVRRALSADSARRADSAKVTAPPPRATGRRPGVQGTIPPAPAADTAKKAEYKPKARIPVNAVVIELAAPLPSARAFRLRASGIRSVTGATRSSERQFNTPRPRPIADSTAKRDTGTVRR